MIDVFEGTWLGLTDMGYALMKSLNLARKGSFFIRKLRARISAILTDSEKMAEIEPTRLQNQNPDNRKSINLITWFPLFVFPP